VGVVEEAVVDRIGVRRVGDVLVPALVRELAGDDRRAQALPVLQLLIAA
jgi:hypothetical protein